MDWAEGDYHRIVDLGARTWIFRDRNPCRRPQSRRAAYERVTAEPRPGFRIAVQLAATKACSLALAGPARPVSFSLSFNSASSTFIAPYLDTMLNGNTAPFVDGLVVTSTTDGEQQWRGAIVDELGRPTTLWLEGPAEPDGPGALEGLTQYWLQRYEGGDARGCPADVYPLQRLTLENRRPKRDAELSIRWYPHVQHPVEVWALADGRAEGLYMAFADDGMPLVMGDHVEGTRHGLWYYFGLRGSPRHPTLIKVEDYFLGTVQFAWAAPEDDIDPLENLNDPLL